MNFNTISVSLASFFRRFISSSRPLVHSDLFKSDWFKSDWWKRAFLLGVGLMGFIAAQNPLLARQATGYLPSDAPVLSVYNQTTTDAETDSVSKADDATLELLSFGPVESGALQYNFVRNDGLGGAGVPFPLYASGDTLYASAGELFDFSIIDSLGIEIGFDETTRVDLVRLSAPSNASWEILNETFTVPLPDSIVAFLPDGIDFQDEMDIGIEAFNTRLPDQMVTTPLGAMDAVVFKPSLNVSVTLYVNTFIGPIPVELSVLENYGVEFYFSESMGIVRELLLPEIVSVSNSTLGINIELAAIPGRELVVREFGEGGGGGGDLVEQEYRAGWNMVSLPVASDDPSAGTHFPDAVSNTLYEFDGSYVLAEQMDPGAGYWLNLSSAGLVTFDGDALPAMSMPLFSGWNLVGALGSETVIEDPDGLIVTGGIFGFDGGYVQAEQLSPGQGYWVASSGNGSVTLTQGASVAGGKSLIGDDLSHLLDGQGYHELQFSTGQGIPLHPLYIRAQAAAPEDGGALQSAQALQSASELQSAHPLLFALPPVPPSGVPDVRFDDNRYLTNTDHPRIWIRQVHPGMTLTLRTPSPMGNADENAQENYKIRFYADANQSNVLQECLLPPEAPIAVPEQAVLAQVLPTEHQSKDPLSTLEQPELLGNYPNPFNPSTTISYRLPADTQVTLEIYSLLGKRIQTLIDTRQSAGSYQVPFDAGNLASGIYLYRLTAGTTSVTRRMILVK